MKARLTAASRRQERIRAGQQGGDSGVSQRKRSEGPQGVALAARPALTRRPLPTKTRGRRWARAELRADRLGQALRLLAEDLRGLAEDLRPDLPEFHPATRQRWRTSLVAWQAELRGLHALLAQLEGLLRLHEPEAEAWLRRRLGELAEGLR